MEMVWQNDHCIQSVRVFCLYITEGLTQFINVISQQVITFPLGEVYREKP